MPDELEDKIVGTNDIEILLDESQKVYLISDTHFDHANIIKYCNRPFGSKYEMNRAMLDNWNDTVSSTDYVLFLGDLVYGREARSADYWLSRLNGKKIFVRGNHEGIIRSIETFNNYRVEYGGENFFLIHDYRYSPNEWDGWVICGHHHNNHLDFAPFIDGINKKINVSVELIDYRPLDFSKLFELDFKNIEYMGTINSIPKMKSL